MFKSIFFCLSVGAAHSMVEAERKLWIPPGLELLRAVIAMRVMGLKPRSSRQVTRALDC